LDVGLIYLLRDEELKDSFSIKGEDFKYLVKVRRHNVGDKVCFRCKSDMSVLHTYEIKEIEARNLHVEKISSHAQAVKSKKNLHVAWCVIDSKSIEKILPSLNEIGVDKISFVHCDRSQRNFKLDFKRFERILEASMQQCGRSSFMEFDTYKSVEDFVKDYPHVGVFDFCDNVLGNNSDFESVLIGCEGGFSQEEKELLSTCRVFRLDTPMILRSESAVMAVASKVLL
jgi:16S rRNA (uracil1498-N3)-methyltransferase